MKSKLLIILVILSLGITSILNGCNNTTTATNSESKTDLSDNQTTNESDSKKTSSIENEAKVDASKKALDTTKEKETSKNSTKKSNEYELTSKNYTKNNVKINYPQIKNLNDSEKLKSINKDLQDGALKILDDYIEEDPNLTTVTLSVNYEVKFKNEKYISIVYRGERYVKGAAYPASILYTTNIDVEKGSSVRLSDYANIDDILKKLKDSKNIKVLAENDELAEAQRNFLLNIGNDKLTNMLKNADFYKINGKIESPKEGTYSYLDKDGIIISVQVNHAIGDHGEFKLIN